MQNDKPDDLPNGNKPTRKILRLPLASLNRMLRSARKATQKAQAYENWIKSVRSERLRTDNQTNELRGDE